MQKNLAALLLFFFVVMGMGFLFSRWWKARTGKLVLPVAQATPSVKPISGNLASLLAKMRPLADNEKTQELTGGTATLTGLVRYVDEEGEITFTVFLLPTVELDSDLFLWIQTPDGLISLGQFENAKGGLLVSGKLASASLPVELLVAPQVKNQKGDTLLSGWLRGNAL